MSVQVTIGEREYFPGIGRIPFEGLESDNPLAFRYYDPDRLVGGRTMAEHLRFSVAYWHSFVNTNADPFGAGTRTLPWNASPDPLAAAHHRLDAAFEFITKLGAPFYCFHDRDLAPEGAGPDQSSAFLQEMVAAAAARQVASGVRLLWGTANLFSHPRYMNGAATNPDFGVVTHAAAQVKAALDATITLGGSNYVFWGGREGYFSLLNTDMKREVEHLARFLIAARDYGRAQGFTGTFLIEPKPMEPAKHQYDYDVASVIGFIERYGLADDFKINIENNHATLAGHTLAHEMQLAANAGLLGSLDVNQGDPHNGWDTDEFLHNLYDATSMMLVLLEYGGIAPGGMNFDAKVRRSSTDLRDLFIGHVHSMDTIARALLTAHDILEQSDFRALREQRYASFTSGPGAAFARGDVTLETLARLASDHPAAGATSGRQEAFESMISRYLR